MPDTSANHAAGSLGCQGFGWIPGRRFCHSPGAANGSAPTGRSPRLMTAARRSASVASVKSVSTRSMRACHPGAPAHEPSSRITRSPDPSRAFCGFRTGPAKPMIAAATARIRNKSSHHGVRSDWFSSSVRPNSRATPGNRRRIGAGGTARSNIHRIGKAIRPSSSHGAVKPMEPIDHIRRGAPARRKAREAHWSGRCRCDGSGIASR